MDGSREVLVEYLGDRAEIFSVRGPATRRKYYFAQTPVERVQLVFIEDLVGVGNVPGLGAIRTGDDKPMYVYAGEIELGEAIE